MIDDQQENSSSTPPVVGDEGDDWLPDDPLYSPQEWRKIKDAIYPLGPSATFSQVCDILKVWVGNYRTAAILERPEKVVGHRHRSEDNRKKLKKSLTALRKSRERLLQGKSNLPAPSWCSRTYELLQYGTMRMRISDISWEADQHASAVLEWLVGGITEINQAGALSVFTAMECVLKDELAAISRRGAPNNSARTVLLEQLIYMWEITKDEHPTVITDRINGMMGSPFYDFAYAVLGPISADLEDTFDTAALSSALKEAVYKRK